MGNYAHPHATEVKVGKGTTYLGRNGNGKVIGLSVSKMQIGSTELIEICPINSKGNIAQCYIQFPAQDVKEIIKALQEQADKN
jgi:hypothetical protein